MVQLAEMLETDSGSQIEGRPEGASVWAGSVGYENYREVAEFVDHLADAGVERLIDVRELPISRRRGYAKTALGQALDERGIEYVHLRDLGNPKPIRDLWKSGEVEQGRSLYRQHLLSEHPDALAELPVLLESKRSALMCVEHDEDICHRKVIFECLRDQLGVDLATERLL